MINPMPKGSISLRCPFAPVGTLSRFWVGNWLPMSKMIAQQRKQKWVPIQGIEDLRDHVKITTSEAALSFVRLLTVPATGLHFQNLWYEVTDVSKLNLAYAFGDKETLREMQVFGEGYFGLVSRSWLEGAHISGPKVNINGRTWKITRTVLTSADSKQMHLCEIKEAVSVDGEYRLIDTKNLGIRPPRGGWQSIPKM